jgi:hypothetical protein
MSINAFGIEASGYTMKELEAVLEMLRFDQPPD